MKPSRQEVFDYFCEVLATMGEEWEDRSAISEDTHLLGNLNWRSIEFVYLANAIQRHYAQTLPFEEFLKDLEQRESKDITVGELVDFIHTNLQDPVAAQ